LGYSVGDEDMKTRPFCRECLGKLARQAVGLSGGDEVLLGSSLQLVDHLFDGSRSPTDISSVLLRYIRHETGVEDPYEERKTAEFQEAVQAAARLEGFFSNTLEGVLRASAFGNGGDFFVEHRYDTEGLAFQGNMAKIEHAVYTSEKVLILGDNPGDFVFDALLVRHLKERSKRVYYAVKARPAQNDMSAADVRRLGADRMREDIVSTGTDGVGLRKDEMTGVVRECWEDGSAVIAKGMGNYESISEFDGERLVIYVMKVKCRSVGEALGRSVGEYIAIAGGGHG
jgi:uncharacterized protein with ATP-grasp and redox domains